MEPELIERAKTAIGVLVTMSSSEHVNNFENTDTYIGW